MKKILKFLFGFLIKNPKDEPALNLVKVRKPKVTFTNYENRNNKSVKQLREEEYNEQINGGTIEFRPSNKK